MKSTEETKTKMNRRAFLRGFGLTAGAAGVAALTLGTAVEAKAEPAGDKPKAGYRETEHVRRIYDLASRF